VVWYRSGRVECLDRRGVIRRDQRSVVAEDCLLLVFLASDSY
jgi:hypothetical protein